MPNAVCRVVDQRATSKLDRNCNEFTVRKVEPRKIGIVRELNPDAIMVRLDVDQSTSSRISLESTSPDDKRIAGAFGITLPILQIFSQYPSATIKSQEARALMKAF